MSGQELGFLRRKLFLGQGATLCFGYGQLSLQNAGRLPRYPVPDHHIEDFRDAGTIEEFSMTSKSRRTQRGFSMVEAALASSVALAILFGILEFGQAVWQYTLVAHAARQGTRYAIVHGANAKTHASSDDITTVVKNQMPGLDGSKVNVAVTWISDNKPGSSVKVVVSYPVTFMGPYVPNGTYTVKSTSQMIIEN